MKRLWVVLAVMISGGVLSGCAAVIGGAAVVGADALIEEEKGGDGLF